MQKTEIIEDVTNELESVKKVKGDLFGELLTLKENFTIER